MKQNNEKNNLLYDFIIFILLISVVFIIFFRSNDIAYIFSTLSRVNKLYVFLGIICTLLYICLESVNIRRILINLGYKKSIFSYIKYSMIGFFFSSITPSSTGGQPMQVYYMNKEGIDISHSSLALLVHLASYQVISICLVVISIIFKFNFLKNLNFAFIIFLIFGFIINLFLTIIYVLAIFKHDVMIKICNFIINILRKLKLKKIDKMSERINDELKKFEKSSEFVRGNKKIIQRTLITNFFQIVINYSVPFLIFKSFGLVGTSYISFVFLQAILYISVSIIPIPGSIGASESGFLSVYSLLFPKAILGPAMILSRGINFYLFVLISGTIVVINHMRLIKNKRVNS